LGEGKTISSVVIPFLVFLKGLSVLLNDSFFLLG